MLVSFYFLNYQERQIRQNLTYGTCHALNHVAIHYTLSEKDFSSLFISKIIQNIFEVRIFSND